MFVNLVVFTPNYKAQENKASKKNLWSEKKLKLFEHKKWNNATTLHLILKQKELVRGVQAQRVELWDLVKRKKKCGENEKIKWNHQISYNLFNKICKHLPIVVNAMHVAPWVILKASKISTLVGMVFKH